MSDVLLLGAVALAIGAGVVIFVQMDTEAEPAQPPLATRDPAWLLPVRGDGSALAAARETREAYDVLFDDSHCDSLKKKNGNCAFRCKRCKKKLAKRKGKVISEAGHRLAGTTRGALASQVIGDVGSLVGQVGNTVAQVYGAKNPATGKS